MFLLYPSHPLLALHSESIFSDSRNLSFNFWDLNQESKKAPKLRAFIFGLQALFQQILIWHRELRVPGGTMQNYSAWSKLIPSELKHPVSHPWIGSSFGENGGYLQLCQTHFQKNCKNSFLQSWLYPLDIKMCDLKTCVNLVTNFSQGMHYGSRAGGHTVPETKIWKQLLLFY